MKNLETLVKAINKAGYHVHLDQCWHYSDNRQYWFTFVFKSGDTDCGVIAHGKDCLTAYSAIKDAIEGCSVPALKEIFK
jgi:hypothetical protein